MQVERTRPGAGRARTTSIVLAAALTLLLVPAADGAAAGPVGFDPARSYPVSGAASGVAVADFDGDGLLDVATADRPTDSVSVLRGTGGALLAPKHTFSTGGGPTNVVAGDFNGDGTTDLATSDQDTKTVTVLAGDGAGEFAASQRTFLASNVDDLATGDLNGDGRADLAVTAISDGRVWTLLGTGSGLAPAVANVVSLPGAIAAGDLDGDGDDDLATGSFFASRVTVSLSNGDGTFAAATNHPTASGPLDVAMGDLDDDGDLDLVTANQGADSVSVLKGTGTGGFATATTHPTGDAPTAVVSGDVDGDGTADLVVAEASAGTVAVLTGGDGGTYTRAASVALGGFPQALVLRDLDADGQRDVVIANGGGALVSVLRNASGAPTELWVAEGGTDAGACAAEAAPCATVTYALSRAAKRDAMIHVSGRIRDHAVVRFPVTISGAGAAVPAVLDGTDSGTVLRVLAGPTSVEDLRVEHGGPVPGVSDGSGIETSGVPLTLTRTVVTQNAGIGSSGGGITHGAGAGGDDLKLVQSTVSGNSTSSGFGGGGIFADGRGGDVELVDSTVSGNSAPDGSGGGIFMYTGRLTLRRSTVAGNTGLQGAGINTGSETLLVATTVADNAGSGIYTGTPLTVLASTIAGNSQEGIVNVYATVTLGASIVADNEVNCVSGSEDPAASPFHSLGANLTDDAAGGSCTFGEATDVNGADPALGPLQDNGGPTPTRMPAGARALRVIPHGTSLGGEPVCQGIDQRGYARPQPATAACAVGAAEPGSALPSAPAFTSPASLTALAGVPFSLTVATSGAPPADLSVASGSSLPTGVEFTDRRDGTATLAGTAEAGRYRFTLRAENGIGSAVTQVVLLTVNAAPTLSVSDLTVKEGNAGTSTATFNVIRRGITTGASSVTVATAGATAGSPGDFTAIPATTVSFAAGQTSRPVTLTVVGDTVPEADETVRLNLTAPVGAAIADSQGVATILNDDADSFLSVGDASITEGASGTANATFPVTRTGSLTAPASVRIKTTDATATAPADYTALAAQTLSFTAGQASRTVSVPVAGDTTLEGDETFTLDLSTPLSGATIADAQGVATIADDEAPTLLSVRDVAMTEGDSGTTAATFTVVRSGDLNRASTVQVVTAAGSATAGTDFTSTSATVSFAAGQSSKPVNVPVRGDLLSEGSETFALELSAPTGAAVSDATATATIADNETPTWISVSDAVVTEATGTTATARFTLTRTGSTTGTATVKVATAPGTATAADYVAINTTYSFAAGVTSIAVSATIAGDSVDEANETFALNLSAALGATIADASATATIVDNDGPVTAGPATFLSIGDIAVREGASGTMAATFTVTRTGTLTAASSVRVASAAGTATAGVDYRTWNPYTLSFAAGVASRTVTVNVPGDALTEDDETFRIELSSPTGAVVSDASATATILNDDAASFVWVEDTTIKEGASGTKNVVITLGRAGNTAVASTVTFATKDGTATGGSDYTRRAATALTFPAGQTARTVSVTVAGDSLPESDEAFTLELTTAAGSGVTLSDASGKATIDNDDAPGSFSVGDLSMPEGNAAGTATFTVSRTGNTTGAASVSVATQSATATAPGDYSSLAATTVAFAAGQTSRTVAVATAGDAVGEPNEAFALNLSNAVGATIADSSATATLRNDDALSYVAIDDASAYEGNAGTAAATFTLTRTGNLAVASTVTVKTRNGTAVAGSDFTARSATVTFAPGESTKTVAVDLTGDTTAEPNETLTLALTSASGATLTDGGATGTIVNDD